MDIETYLAKEGLEQITSEECTEKARSSLSDRDFAQFVTIWNDLIKLPGRETEQRYYNFACDHGLNFIDNCFRVPELKGTLPQILKYLSTKTGARILDVGCGDGLAMAYHALNLPKSNFLGIDINEKRLHLAEERIKKYKLNNVTFEKADALNLPYIQEFDIVLASNFMHESSELFELLFEEKMTELKKVLKPTGQIVICTMLTRDHNDCLDELKVASESIGLEETNHQQVPCGYNYFILTYEMPSK